MVISLILFRCAKHSILPRKTGTWEKRVPSSYGQNSIAQSHKMQYLQPFFFLYHSLLIIQHKILFQWLSGFDNKQQISDLYWKEKGILQKSMVFIRMNISKRGYFLTRLYKNYIYLLQPHGEFFLWLTLIIFWRIPFSFQQKSLICYLLSKPDSR